MKEIKEVIVAPSERKRSLFYLRGASSSEAAFLLWQELPSATAASDDFAFLSHSLRSCEPPSLSLRGTEGEVVRSLPFPARTALSLVLADGKGFRRRPPRDIVEAFGLVNNLILRSTNASFQSSVGAFGSVPPEGPNRTELLFERKVFQEVQVRFLCSIPCIPSVLYKGV